MLLFTEFFLEEMAINLVLAAEMDDQEGKVKREDEGEEAVKNHGEADQVCLLGIFSCEVDKAEEHEHLHPFRDIEM